MKIRIIAGLLCLFIAGAFGRWFLCGSSYRILETKYEAILDEVMSVDFPYRYLTPDNSGAALAYVHEAEQGRGLFLMNLNALKQEQLQVTNEVIQIAGWSPDDRYLAFVQTPPHLPDKKVRRGSALAKEEWITLYDRETKEIRRLTSHKNVIESRFLWLSPTSYVFVSRKLAGSVSEAFVGSFDSKPVRMANYLPILDNLILTTENIAAYTDKGEIFTMNLSSPTNTASFLRPRPYTNPRGEVKTVLGLGGDQITNFKKEHGFSSLRWLRYDRKNEKFLFCATPRKSNWRYLYSYNSADKQLTQLSWEDTYNGQILEEGKGFAYVANSNFVFSLSIHPAEPAGRTNFFSGGGLSSYVVAPKGDKIYAVAAQGVEPESIWEYDLKTRNLKLVASGFNKPFVVSRVIEPQVFKITSFDGLEVPSFLYPPLDIYIQTNKSIFQRRTKYPAIIYCPPATAAAKRVFNARMQLLSNLGFYVLAMNYRGCQGYGAKYASLANTEFAAEDILSGYDFLLKNSNVDKDRIFLSSDSAGSSVVNELLATRPDLWRAVSIENPGGINWNPLDPAGLPPIFYAVGDQDSVYKSMLQFDEWAKSNKVSVSSVVYTNSGHITYKTSQRKDKLDRVAKFFISHL